MIRLFFIVLILISCFACEKEATGVKLPTATPKLVLGCFLSTSDSVIAATVTRSNPIYTTTNSNGNNVIANAAVTITDGSNTVPLVYNTIKERYEIKTQFFPLIGTREYTVSATASGYNPVFGNCVLPPSAVTWAEAAIAKGPYGETKLMIKWNDIPNEKNYYCTRVKYVAVNDSIGSNDTVYVWTSNDYTKTTFTDNAKDGQELFCQLEGYMAVGMTVYPNGYKPNTKPYRIKGYLIEILNVDYNYYLYQSTLYNHLNSQSDPFSEASFVFTNVDKGLGVVAAYRGYSFIKS